MAIFTKGTWDDRVSDNITRRALTVVSATGTSGIAQGDVITADIARADTNVSVLGTPFNHNNMDGLEERIKSTFETVKSVTVLYNNNSTSGRTSNFTLSQSCYNFDYLGIYYVAPGGQISGYSEINATDATEFCCSLSYPSAPNDAWYLRSAYLVIGSNGTSVEMRRNATATIKFDGSNNSITTSEKIGIKRVVGYKLA